VEYTYDNKNSRKNAWKYKYCTTNLLEKQRAPHTVMQRPILESELMEQALQAYNPTS
jgi:hypothetical protein